MDKSELIACFKDTLELCNCDALRSATAKAKKSNKIYKEGFVFKQKNNDKQADIIVDAITTYAAAKRYGTNGKVAVLNFANPENPGGGVWFGAMAQEECLCRSSNLFLCLNDSNVYNDFYAYHRNLNNPFYSDRLIYTKDVTVFKDDSTVPQLMPEKEWFMVDVITCAAPYLAKQKYTNLTVLKRLFEARIQNIIEAAIDNHVEVLILGAFGCGAFKNPPQIVAEAFAEVIRLQNYRAYFDKIIFGIKPTEKHCKNLSAFLSQFDQYTSDAGERYAVLCESLEMQFYRIPKLPNASLLHTDCAFRNWQVANPYFGKRFSILGDSISTLEGYNPRDYKVFYGGENCKKSGVNEMEDTWWEKVIEFFGGELLVNNSWSGSRVTKLHNRDELFPSGCSDERTSSLHRYSAMPDIIIIYLGTNDWAFGAATGCESQVLNIDDNELFEHAYDNMLEKLKKNYPCSGIWCCTLSETYISERPDFKFPHMYGGTHIEVYNDIIQRVSRKRGCKLIDLYGRGMPYDSMDGSHPTRAGMDMIAIAVIRAAAGPEINQFMDCADNMHEFVVSEQYTREKYICKKCGKIICKKNFLSKLFKK